jgi:hypothetical protein
MEFYVTLLIHNLSDDPENNLFCENIANISPKLKHKLINKTLFYLLTTKHTTRLYARFSSLALQGKGKTFCLTKANVLKKIYL